MKATLKWLSTPSFLNHLFYSEPPPKQRKGNEKKVKHIDITSIPTHITPKYFFIHRRIKENTMNNIIT